MKVIFPFRDNYLWTFLIFFMVFACSGRYEKPIPVERQPEIFPDYTDVVLPPNIAPLRFQIREAGEKFLVKIYTDSTRVLTVHTGNGIVRIPANAWKSLLYKSKGEDIYFAVWSRKGGKWYTYQTIRNHIASERIDSFLVYRLIDPGYEIWNNMGIYQRCLENFTEKPVMINSFSDGNCMNCHSFCQNKSNLMLFHMRARNAGTIVYRNGELHKVNTKTEKTISPGVYPAWHPGGRYVAFSVNRIIQRFHSVKDKKIEVQDTLSDIVLYDAQTNTLTTSPVLSSADRFETFPAWSPDGKFLYYCSAKALPPQEFNKIKYDLLRVSFDANTRKFGTEADTILSSAKTGMSISFPRVSPDGRFILFCMSVYGNFTIWHRESDLYLFDLVTGSMAKPDINSDQAESYHSWSSNGHWIVFSSRRINGLYTMPFFAYFDGEGHFSKPFLLPQANPLFYDLFMKSFNVPEFVTSEINLSPRILAGIAKKEAEKTVYVEKEE